MSAIKTIGAVMMMMLAASAANAQTTWYVDDDACPGAGSGTQADPFCSIQAGIDAAAAVNRDDVLVADGTYNEVINFNGKGIAVRSAGGAGVTTIDGTGLNDSVVKCISGEGPDTVLDGFTVTGGTGTKLDKVLAFGGGMYNANMSSPTVTNCTFTGNSAHAGGGMINEHESNPTVTNCTFRGNSAHSGGGMFNGDSSRPTVTNCTFIGNTADDNGGGMVNEVGSTPTVSNCTFSGNTANTGGGMHNSTNNSFTSPTITSCILWGDSPDEIKTINSSPTVSFSDVQGGLPPSAHIIDLGGNIDADPLFVDADGDDDTVGTPDDDLRLSAGSPAIDSGNTPAYLGPATDIGGNPRAVDDRSTPDTGVPNVGIAIPFLAVTIDMGAHEFNPGCPRPPHIRPTRVR